MEFEIITIIVSITIMKSFKKKKKLKLTQNLI
jgi:hypothetical protein